MGLLPSGSSRVSLFLTIVREMCAPQALIRSYLASAYLPSSPPFMPMKPSRAIKQFCVFTVSTRNRLWLWSLSENSMLPLPTHIIIPGLLLFLLWNADNPSCHSSWHHEDVLKTSNNIMSLKTLQKITSHTYILFLVVMRNFGKKYIST